MPVHLPQRLLLLVQAQLQHIFEFHAHGRQFIEFRFFARRKTQAVQGDSILKSYDLVSIARGQNWCKGSWVVNWLLGVIVIIVKLSFVLGINKFRWIFRVLSMSRNHLVCLLNTEIYSIL